MEWQLKSHPDKTLKDHLINVYRIGQKKLKMIISKDKRLDKIINNFELLNKIILITHDFGKATSFFQQKLDLAINAPKSDEYKKLKNDKHTYHSRLSALFTFYILNKTFADPKASIVGYMVVNKHHGNLENLKDNFCFLNKDWQIIEEQFSMMNLEELEEILKLVNLEISLQTINISDLREEINSRKFKRNLRKLRKNLCESDFFIVNLLYSILISADKGEVIFTKNNQGMEELNKFLFSNEELDKNLVDNYRKFKGWDNPKNNFNKLRNQVYKNIISNIEDVDLKRKILSINVPTGIGKTAASFSAALKLRKKLKVKYNKNFRIIYTLPFTSVIDQNYEFIKEMLERKESFVSSKLLIRHHYLTAKTFKDENYDDVYADLSEYLIEVWNSEIVVSTFVQLLESILTNKNRNLKKFHNMAYSIIILDEVQAIPHKYWTLIKKVFLNMAKIMDCYFIFVTATMPLIFSEEKNEIKELASDKKDFFAVCDRIELDLSYFQTEMTLEEFEYFLADELNDYYPKNSFLIVLNTIKTSIEIYKFIKEELEYNNVIYLSKNIIAKDIKDRISQIKESKESLIVVSTQMVEAGVDIDFDRVYRDFAPLDSINQTCGRCNRNFNSNKKGKVIIVKLINKNDRNCSYASYVYGNFLLKATEDILYELPNIITEKEFFKMNKKYFNIVNKDKSDDLSEEILHKMKELKYTSAFEDDGNGSYFKLIDHRYVTINFFIELNEEAANVWIDYINLVEIKNPWDRKMAFEQFKEIFLNYVVTVSKDIAKKQFSEEELSSTFNYISFDQLDNVYDLETGFKREAERDYFF